MRGAWIGEIMSAARNQPVGFYFQRLRISLFALRGTSDLLHISSCPSYHHYHGHLHSGGEKDQLFWCSSFVSVGDFGGIYVTIV
ncbi:conserved hypothetical protein [Ricinus communis]|uniref:Uncharacterized protein n=1 Tax=Ricinus communis TaxID=3988 RepID=B9RBB9_RICCO|nr:conserved hypothetical protein [Ricinus communis]